MRYIPLFFLQSLSPKIKFNLSDTRNAVLLSSCQLSLIILQIHLSKFRGFIYLDWITFFNFFSSVQSLSHVQLFVTPWTAASQVSLSITNSRSLLKLTSVESVMPFSHLILCCPLLLLLQSLPGSESFTMSQQFTLGGKVVEFQL